MTDQLESGAAPAKAPPPPLMGRAPRPSAIRIRKPVVQALALGAASLLAGALTWAFIIQPDLKARGLDDRERAETRDHDAVVRPPDGVTGQPESYDRLPVRQFGDTPEPDVAAADPVLAAPSPVPPARWTAPDRLPARAASVTAREQAARSDLFFADVVRPSPAATPPASQEGAASSPSRPATALTRAASPYELKAGAVIPAVLLTGVDTSRPGPVVAMVSQSVFDSVTGRHLLLPQGSRLIGRHEGDSAYGDRRAFLTWERLILPDGASLVLDAEPGVDALGHVGIQGRIDRRLVDLGMAALASGLIGTIGEYARGGADEGDRGSFLGNAGDAASLEAARVGGKLVDRELQVRPAIRVAPGAAVRVLVTRDLVLEPWRP